MDCLFCNFGAKKPNPTYPVYENEQAVAFLDIHPNSPGHTVIIPRAHAEQLSDLSGIQLAGLFVAVQSATDIIGQAMGTKDFTIGINHGRGAGSAFDHLHVHIMPRFPGDGGTSIHRVVDNPPQEPLATIAERIKNVQHTT